MSKNLIPTDLKYTASHEWVREETDGTVTLGITDHAQGLLGDIVYVELPDMQKKLAAGESCGVVESVKAAADVYSPFASQVIGINQELTEKPELMNVDPYGDGWLCRLQITDKAALSKLLDATSYKQAISKE